MSELLPCPFCGGDPTLIVGSVAFNDYEVQCDTCGFSGPNFGALDQEPFPREDAVRHWNTRTDVSDVSDALVAAAREQALREAAEQVNRNLGKPAHHAHAAILALIEKDQ